MPQRTSLADADCAIAQALDVVGDWWTLLIVRDTARGVHRFDALQQELGVSRKVLTERLRLLVEAGCSPASRTRTGHPGTSTGSPRVDARCCPY